MRDAHELTLTFPLPCLDAHYRTKAEHYVSHLAGHEGAGSLLSALKARGWATEVRVPPPPAVCALCVCARFAAAVGCCGRSPTFRSCVPLLPMTTPKTKPHI